MEIPVNQVVTETPQTYSLTERDLRLSLIAEQIQGLLLEALKAHALGAIDYLKFQNLPARTQRDLTEAAQASVMELAPDRDQLADVHAREVMKRWMEAEASGIAFGRFYGPDKFVVESAFKRLIEVLTRPLTPNLSTECRHAYRHSLCQPDARSKSAQLARAAMNTFTGPVEVPRICRAPGCENRLTSAREKGSGTCDPCVQQWEARR